MKLKIYSALLAVYVVWGSTYLAIRIGVETIPPFLMAGTRFLVAGALLYLVRRLLGDPAPTARQWRSAAIIGVFLLLGGNGLVTWAEQRVVSGVAALVVASAPLWIVLLDAIRPGGRRPALWTLVGVLVGFVGIVILVGPSQLTGISGGVDPLGAVVLTFAALFWAIGSLYGRSAALPASPLMGTSMEMLSGSAALFLSATLLGEWSRLDLAAISARSAYGLLYLIVFGALVGFAAYSWLMRVAPLPLVATYAYVNPLVAIFVGYLFAAEPLSLRILLAALIIAGSVALITFTQPVSQAKPAADPEVLPASRLSP